MAGILDGSSKDKVFDNGILSVRGNIFTTEDCFIQVSNISRVYASEMPHKSLLGAVLLALLGLFFCGLRQVPLGVMVIIIACIIGFVIFNKNQQNKYALFLELNSGEKMVYLSSNINFLRQVANVLANIVVGLVQPDMTVNFTTNQFENIHGNVVSGGNVENLITYGA